MISEKIFERLRCDKKKKSKKSIMTVYRKL